VRGKPVLPRSREAWHKAKLRERSPRLGADRYPCSGLLLRSTQIHATLANFTARIMAAAYGRSVEERDGGDAALRRFGTTGF